MIIKNAEILCVGTELLLGEVVNTNAAYIGRSLARLGISVYHTGVVGDNPERLADAVRSALSRSDLLILSGGLGPTYDDLTKETVAEVLGLEMVRNAEILSEIEEYFHSQGKNMPENNAKQADIPCGAEALPNATGTAPGIFVSTGEKVVVLLPGPPFELEPMFDNYVFPRLREMSDRVLVSHNLHIMGMGESEVEAHLVSLMRSSTNPTLAPYAKEGETRLRVSALAPSETEGEDMCRELINKIYETPVGEFIYGVDVAEVERYALRELERCNLTLGTAESCTGGWLGKRITDIPGASRMYRGGFITYSDEEKKRLLGVGADTLDKFSAVSAEVAREMASGARERLGVDIALSVTGEAGPVPDPKTGASVGTVFIGISSETGTRAVRLSVSPRRGRDYIRKVACSRALREILAELKTFPRN